MPLVDLRIELPAYSHSFTVQVQQSSTIRDVKHEITKCCPGAPRPDGQRLVCRGRFLNDEEKVLDIWKSPEDSRVIHLAVHPSSWSSAPPSLSSQSTFPSAQPQHAQPYPPRQHPSSSSPQPSQSTSLPSNSPLLYVVLRHNLALSVLRPNVNAAPLPQNHGQWRSASMTWLRNHGWSWPSVIDEEFPPSERSGQGLNYECVSMNNVRYLMLATPTATPTPAQIHAFKILSHTYAILSYALSSPDSAHAAPPSSYTYSYTVAVPLTNLNNHLQQVGLPPLRLAPGPNANPNDPNNPLAAAAAAEMRAIPLRALIIPLIMLVFRTLLVIYFFSPSKRPLFGIIISAWILYEAWGAMRIVLGDDRGRAAPPGGVEGNGALGAHGAGPAPNAQGGGQPAPGQPQRARGGRNASQSHAHTFLNTLSKSNLDTEEASLDADYPVPVPAPSLGHKIRTFVGLLFLTLHPATWDHRRALLRRREGRIRTEANARDAAPTGEEQDEAHAKARLDLVTRHERRPAWIKEYIRRVQTTEWLDDA
ncbi:hypothetical protein BKA93DRAFT_742938 [Sparassis latifolia]|uniref:Ubiquitin-like domain-containing protein n=1 Tax=Sparassis crispa TaxID=139825 RepID=A0A401GAY8_9APHY|nr:hypothetical protein SCP_0205380 [Sparassis crispa]GBE79340.1 hypothetical protein SCP_0205380 [Sparassis crispa]